MAFKTHIDPPAIVRRILVFLCVGFLLFAAGCSGGYGRIRSNEAISQAFESNQVPDDYKYYYYGRSNMPYAIIGLDSAYSLKSRLWLEVDPSSEAFRKMVKWIWWDTYYYPNMPRGKDILDPNGKKIGIWYSSARWAAVITLDEKGTVIIAPDTPWDLGGF